MTSPIVISMLLLDEVVLDSCVFKCITVSSDNGKNRFGFSALFVSLLLFGLSRRLIGSDCVWMYIGGAVVVRCTTGLR